MEWRKTGLIFEPPQNLSWMVSHAALPFAHHIENDVYKLYFSGRDHLNRAHIGWCALDLSSAPQVREVAQQPSLVPGALGAFDDSGVTMSWITFHQGRQFLFYTGWSLGVTVPFYFGIGLAVSDDEGRTFQKLSDAPLFERSAADPFLAASPCVLLDNGLWRMWYVSGVRWEMENGKPKHFYHVKYAESPDGVNWQRRGVVCIDFKSPDEYAISRPCVVKDDALYRMWYSYRGGEATYRIGYAESPDGLHWTRKDEEAGIDVSPTGWDSQMLAYPFVFSVGADHRMLYNGNGYGNTGIGLANALNVPNGKPDENPSHEKFR